VIGFLRRRWTLRVRLTVVYAAIFLVAGLAVVGITYLLMQTSLGDMRGMFEKFGFPDKESLRNAFGPKGTLVEDALQSYRQLALKTLLQQGGAALAVVGFFAVWTSWAMAGRILRPITAMTATARRVAERNLHERINATGAHDEIRELADTLDSMLDRLDRAFDGQRRFVGNASHELRTPLAINRTLLEVALGTPNAQPELRQLCTTLLEVNARHERLIDGLLVLAKSDHALTITRPVDLAGICEHLIEPLAVPVESCLDSALVAGDPVLLERLVLNLVQNAVRYNVPNGRIWIATGTADGVCTLTIANTGPVIGAYEVPLLFEPFRRLGAERVGSARGTGLGLSIVRSVALAHNGDVQAVPRSAADGGGLVVTVTLPAATVEGDQSAAEEDRAEQVRPPILSRFVGRPRQDRRTQVLDQ
jgi:signal transduction histidine kinase